MKLVTFVQPGAGATPGIVDDDGTVRALSSLGIGSILALVEAGPQAWERARSGRSTGEQGWPIGEVDLLAPIPRPPRNMVCVGLNYRSHVDEGIRDVNPGPTRPIVFSKPWTTLIGAGGYVIADRAATQQIDWEAEIAVVIGVGGRNIHPDSAADHVFGCTLANDVSARDLQLAVPGGQWLRGKSLDTFCPMGPWIVTMEELAGINAIDVELRVNDVTKQRFCSADMINSVGEIIAYASLGTDLLPGDVILTGTAAGVGYWQEPQQFLCGGDVVEIDSPQLGLLRHGVVERTPT